ncbi:MAG: RNA polymerase-binding protein RbpA [Actinomycetes bacterium]|jgi:hypothetical protein
MTEILRGTRLGATSYENETHVELAPRQVIDYICPVGHVSSMMFSMEADVPALWECRCGAEALRRNGEKPEVKATKPARTHWDMLLERRTIDDLETLLAERLEVLHVTRTSATKAS